MRVYFICAAFLSIVGLVAAGASAAPIKHYDDNDAHYVAYKAENPDELRTLMQARAALKNAISGLERHGLSPNHYQAQLNAVAANDQLALMRFVAEVVADLRFGATREKQAWDAQKETVQSLLHKLVECRELGQCLQRIAARHPQYEPLQITLQDYEQVALSGGWPTIQSGKAIKPNQRDARVPDIRERLRLSGDYYSSKPAFETSTQQPEDLYDAELVEAMKQFQKRHGLEQDGVVGSVTLAALNVPVETRISQLKLSLERLRRLPDLTDKRYVQVNIPSYELTAYEGTKQTLKMDVIVGKKARPTPMFDNVITTVGLNPTWTPTYKILSRDLLPKFRRDPGYAQRGGYSVRDRHTGQALNPSMVNWASVSARDVRVVQRSGSRNALGKVKFLLPDNDSVYLHDTAKPQLFSSAMRALSSGCIRLSQPEAFLDYIIASQSDERFGSLREYYAGNSNKHITLDEPVRVRMTYFTAWVNDEGQVSFYDDVYRKDDRLQLALERESRQFAMR